MISIEDLCEDTRRFVDDIQKEPDRGVPIVACAFLDEVLGKLLEAYFISDSKITKKLLIYPGPLSHFSAKIDIVYCMGLIPQKTYADICLIKNIRNQFSHSHYPVDFQDKKISELCNALNFAKITLERMPCSPSARSKFEISAISVINTILMKALSLNHAKLPKNYEVAETVVVG